MEERNRETQARENNEVFSSNDDDARSVTTIVPHELGRVDEEMRLEVIAEREDRRWSSREVGQPRTLEPSPAEFEEGSPASR